MSFWRDAHWQHSTADALEATLRDVHARLMPRNVGNSMWTAEIMETIGALAATHCPDGACAYKRSRPTQWYAGGEWMFDLVWLVQQGPFPNEFARTLGVPLVLECEWLGWRDVWDDFDKLLLPRAGLRVFIFALDTVTPANWVEILLERAQAFADTAQDDAWLFCGWTSEGFTCHRHIGAAA